MPTKTVAELLRTVDPAKGLLLDVAGQRCLASFSARGAGVVAVDVSVLDGSDRSVVVEAAEVADLAAVVADALERHGQPDQWPVWGSASQPEVTG